MGEYRKVPEETRIGEKTMGVKTSGAPAEISAAATLGRTICLVGMTIGLLVLVRLWPPATHWMEAILRGTFWPKIYELFHVESELGREQILLGGIVLICFGLALIVQMSALWALGRLKRARPAQGSRR